MGEHVTGVLNVYIKSDNSTPPGQTTTVVITITGETTAAKKQVLIQAIKDAATTAGLEAYEV